MAAPAFLGIDTKSAAATNVTRRNSGTSISKSAALVDVLDGQAASRVIKYRLQAAARRLLPDERVAKCHRFTKEREFNENCVDLMINKATGKASFGNVITCGSVWLCPVCAVKISSGRGAEMGAALAAHRMQGGQVIMMTNTFPHQLDQPLEDNLKKLSQALSKFKGYAATKRILKNCGAIGTIRAMEVTHGANGWHPHAHHLIFIDNQTPDVIDRLERLRDLWAKAVFSVGLGQINEHGFKLNNGDYAADYIAKFGRESKGWTVTHEMTKSHTKRGRKDSRTPFDLLRDYMAGDNRAGALFLEYARAFKGVRQLYYSPDLKKRLNMQDVSDQELAEEVFEEKEIIGVLDQRLWQIALRTNTRGEVLHYAEKGGFQAAVDFLERRAAAIVDQDDAWYWSIEGGLRYRN
jgi:hypothetical protein